MGLSRHWLSLCEIPMRVKTSGLNPHWMLTLSSCFALLSSSWMLCSTLTTSWLRVRSAVEMQHVWVPDLSGTGEILAFHPSL